MKNLTELETETIKAAEDNVLYLCPQAGQKCEYKKKSVKYRQDFTKVKILFVSSQLFVMEHLASGNHFSERAEDCEFRLQQPKQEQSQ